MMNAINFFRSHPLERLNLFTDILQGKKMTETSSVIKSKAIANHIDDNHTRLDLMRPVDRNQY